MRISTSKYLTKEDFSEPQLLTISKVAKENVARNNEPEELKWVLYFKENGTGLVLNKTNIRAIMDMTGTNETDVWSGKQVVAYNDPRIEFGGKIVGGIRLRAPRTEPGKTKIPQNLPPVEDEFDSEVPF